MNIGELAKRSGLTHSRIRFYESVGLLNAVERRPNGYRTYPREAVAVLDIITTAQKAGFSLDEVRALLPENLGNWQHGQLVDALQRKVADIEALQARLATSKAHLVDLIREIEAKPDDIDCSTNARRVMDRLLDGDIGRPAMGPDDVKLLGRTRQPARKN